jgi:hypothetical protein
MMTSSVASSAERVRGLRSKERLRRLPRWPAYLTPASLSRSWGAVVMRRGVAVGAWLRGPWPSGGVVVDWRRGVAVVSGVVVLAGSAFIYNSFGHTAGAGREMPSRVSAAGATPGGGSDVSGSGAVVATPVVSRPLEADGLMNKAGSGKTGDGKVVAAVSGSRPAGRHRTEVIAEPTITWFGAARPAGVHRGETKEPDGTSHAPQGAGRGGSKAVPD